LRLFIWIKYKTGSYNEHRFSRITVNKKNPAAGRRVMKKNREAKSGRKEAWPKEFGPEKSPVGKKPGWKENLV
jgi:hypothetical protein